MASEVGTDPLGRGATALAERDWQVARIAFEEALATAETPEAHDGLGLSLWWLRDVDAAIAHREQAYATFRERGDLAAALRIALWLATEYLEAVGNEPASRGWLARAEGLLPELPDGPHTGWFALTRGRLRPDPADAVDDAEAAIAMGRERRDPDLEASGIALLGLALVDRGDVEQGLARLDEAMAAATGGEVADPAVFGDVCCLVTRAAEDAGDVSRLMRWNEVVMAFMERSGHAGLLEFCGTCCAEVLIANGQLAEAEGWLARTLRELEGTGHRARCIHPAAKFAELRMLQGRVEDAERLLAGYEDRADALRATARLHLLRGEPAVAAALLHRRLNQVGDGLLALPLLALLVEVQVARGDAASAGELRRSPRLDRSLDRPGPPARRRGPRTRKGGARDRRCRRPGAPRGGGPRIRRAPDATRGRRRSHRARDAASPTPSRRSPRTRPAWRSKRPNGPAPVRWRTGPPRSSASSAARHAPARSCSACSASARPRSSASSGRA